MAFKGFLVESDLSFLLLLILGVFVHSLAKLNTDRLFR